MNAALNGPTVRADRTVMAQPPRPTTTPTLADRDSVAAARASAHTAVIGISQPNVTAAVAPDARTQGVQECDAAYYAGIKKLLAGDKTGAADAFRKCLATCHKEQREYQFAQDELKSLTP